MDDPGDSSSLEKTSNKHEHDSPREQTGGDGENNIRAEGDDALSAGGLEEGSQKKLRVRNEEHGSSSSAMQKPKRKVELLEIPERDPNCVVCGKNFNSWKALFGHMRSHPERQTWGVLEIPERDPNCVVCGKNFNSWKALFGHMRSHPERQWRGVFPPPTGSWDPSVSVDREAEPGTGMVPDLAQEEIATALLNVAQGVLATLTSSVVATSNTAEGSKVDEAEASASSPTRGLVIDLNQPQEKSSKALKFDLNLPPANDEDIPEPP
ncbi:Zinc finger protein ZAT3 [Morella rubra]|uniref:Zinc finger protein ZAT3 n=1 Tax=Morella rubra TaxID=262757 RepID=A0A6A1UPG6_9ROSI|nr:Zinc finger protein ZAT3 [Morella rubra]